MAVTLSDSAAARVANYLEKRGAGAGLRLGVKTSGCSGLAYILEFVDTIDESDEVFVEKGVTVIIDKKSYVYLDGIELDFVKEGLNEGFEFNNPNMKGECGCGESFSV
ncbi:iron-sulfur cluster assembly protein IscA [Moritella dasanensis]|jgi:iron-sulfur cluster assembly protein|uniref:iron-sulfur cluster assembly protein IscA n=1 Tax=Moritella dasanensis TaxID=428031 RepID=UPI00031E79E2|nr:iron-sulfur cluster assembly protein IscA [Moritella dasanensis]